MDGIARVHGSRGEKMFQRQVQRFAVGYSLLSGPICRVPRAAGRGIRPAGRIGPVAVKPPYPKAFLSEGLHYRHLACEIVIGRQFARGRMRRGGGWDVRDNVWDNREYVRARLGSVWGGGGGGNMHMHVYIGGR